MAGKIPQHFIDDLLNRVDIVELIDGRVPLKKAGREYHAGCPFHREKTPSFTVSPTKQFYHCFGCGAHGDIVGFVMGQDNLSFIEAVERLAVFLLYLRHRRLLAERLAEHASELASVDLPMSRQDIADFLGLKKETVSRSFTQLDERGLITRPDSYHAEILDLEGLRELAGIQDFSTPLRLVSGR